MVRLRSRRSFGASSAATSAVLIAAALVLAACGGDDGTPVTDPAPPTAPPAEAVLTTADLDGRELVSVSVDGHDLVEGTVITLSFADGSLSANAGCNTIFGSFDIDDGRLVAEDLASTAMACADELMVQDRWLTDILAIGSTITTDGDSVVLDAPGGATVAFDDA